MIYRILHTTSYEYAEFAEACHNLAHLRPRDLPGLRPRDIPVQTCLEMQLRIDPPPDRIHEYRDYFGNHVHSFAVYQTHQQLAITAESIVSHAAHELPPASNTPAWNVVRDALRTDRTPEIVAALELRFDSPYIRTSPALRDLAAPHFPPDRPLGEAALALTKAIQRDFRYDPEATTIDTSLAEVLKRRRGVCQDFAHLLIGCLRSLGLACRYVSGYLRTDPQPGRPRLVGADASHAWVSVFCPRTGWLDFDPTNGCRPTDRHITIGWGRDFHDLSPLKGIVLGGGQSSLKVAVDVVAAESAKPQPPVTVS